MYPMFARKVSSDVYAILDADGTPVTKILDAPTVWPLEGIEDARGVTHYAHTGCSAEYDHPRGIFLSGADVVALGLPIDWPLPTALG